MYCQTQTFQSRWGYHPCSYETSRRLKLISKVYHRAINMAAKWKRWKRKDPKNRAIRQKIRNELGQVIGYQKPIPMPEPILCPIFTTFDIRDGNTTVTTNGSEWVVDCAQARRPQPTQAATQPLTHTTEEIDELFQKASAWLGTTP